MPNFRDQTISLTLTGTITDVGVTKTFVTQHIHRHNDLTNLFSDDHPQYLTEDRGVDLFNSVLNDRGITQTEPVVSGEVNDGINLGDGVGVFRDKIGEDLRFCTFVESDNIIFKKIGSTITAEFVPTIEIIKTELGFSTKQLLEVGEFLDATNNQWQNLEFQVTINRDPQSFTLSTPAGETFPIRTGLDIPGDLTGPFQKTDVDDGIEFLFSYGQDKFRLNVPGTKNFIITAATSTKSDESIVTFTWAHKLYFGVSVSPGSFDESFIKGLDTSQVSVTRNITFTLDSGSVSDSPNGKKMYFALPVDYGDPSFLAGDLPGGFGKVSASPITVQNDNNGAVLIQYDLWESDESDLGEVIVKVS